MSEQQPITWEMLATNKDEAVEFIILEFAAAFSLQMNDEVTDDGAKKVLETIVYIKESRRGKERISAYIRAEARLRKFLKSRERF